MSQIQPARRSPEAFDHRSADKRDMGAELDNIFRLTALPPETSERPKPAAPAALPPEPRRESQSDLDAALEMLTRAAQAMDILQARYHQVESYARDIAARAERDLAQAYGEIKEWETRALASEAKFEGLKARVEEEQRQTETAMRRAELAERQAEVAQRRADQAERSATEAREWLECFHDKIVASFDSRPFLRAAAA